MIGYAFCGSFCTLARSVEQLKILAQAEQIVPIMSECVYSTDTRFGESGAFRKEIEEICGRKIIHTIKEAEPLGPAVRLDALIISPCTGNTLAKIANGITDTAVCMAAKAHLRGDNPLVIALASNDAMSANLKNIAALLLRKNVYFVPMRQDDPASKPHSLVAEFSQVVPSYIAALNGKQSRPIFI